jgi:hypothetical protein
MPVATTCSDLIATADKDFAALQKIIATVQVDAALKQREDKTSIKDITAHRAHLIDLSLGWYSDGQAGQTVQMPARGYKLSDLKAYNAKLRADQADMSWPQACATLEDRHAALGRFLTDHTDQDFYGAPMLGGNGKWTGGRYAEAASAFHYRSAAKWIRAALREDASQIT